MNIFNLVHAVSGLRIVRPTLVADAPGSAANAQDSADSGAAASGAARGNWLQRMLDRMDDWARGDDTREREAYLARATDLCDLETRLRRLDAAAAARDGLFH
jgi:Protein of unknown function (DUF3563)